MLFTENNKKVSSWPVKYSFVLSVMKKVYADAISACADDAGIKERMCADEFGCYTICNIYYDTDDFRLIRASLEKPVYKKLYS